jgi:hypothetical protein
LQAPPGLLQRAAGATLALPLLPLCRSRNTCPCASSSRSREGRRCARLGPGSCCSASWCGCLDRRQALLQACWGQVWQASYVAWEHVCQLLLNALRQRHLRRHRHRAQAGLAAGCSHSITQPTGLQPQDMQLPHMAATAADQPFSGHKHLRRTHSQLRPTSLHPPAAAPCP